MAAAEGGRYLSKALLGRGSERSRLCRVPALPPPGPLPLLHLSSSQGASAPWSRWDPRALSVGRCAAASGARERVSGGSRGVAPAEGAGLLPLRAAHLNRNHEETQ